MCRQAMLIGDGTYGYYYEESKTFECTHGAWSSELIFVNSDECRLTQCGDKVFGYKNIDIIPEDYIR